VEPAQIKERDIRLLRLALGVSTKSPDPTTKVGAVLANDAGIALVWGTNRFPTGITHDHRLDDRPLKNEIVIHAEPNVVLQALGKFGAQEMPFMTLYITHLPCARCTGIILDAGIGSVVCIEPSKDFFSRWGASCELSRSLFEEAGVPLTEYSNEELYQNGKEEPE